MSYTSSFLLLFSFKLLLGLVIVCSLAKGKQGPNTLTFHVPCENLYYSLLCLSPPSLYCASLAVYPPFPLRHTAHCRALKRRLSTKCAGGYWGGSVAKCAVCRHEIDPGGVRVVTTCANADVQICGIDSLRRFCSHSTHHSTCDDWPRTAFQNAARTKFVRQPPPATPTLMTTTTPFLLCCIVQNFNRFLPYCMNYI